MGKTAPCAGSARPPGSCTSVCFLAPTLHPVQPLVRSKSHRLVALLIFGFLATAYVVYIPEFYAPAAPLTNVDLNQSPTPLDPLLATALFSRASSTPKEHAPVLVHHYLPKCDTQNAIAIPPAGPRARHVTDLQDSSSVPCALVLDGLPRGSPMTFPVATRFDLPYGTSVPRYRWTTPQAYMLLAPWIFSLELHDYDEKQTTLHPAGLTLVLPAES